MTEPDHEAESCDEIVLGESEEHDPAVACVPGLDEFVAYLQTSRGIDIRGYKRVGLERRLGKRVRALGLTSFSEYIDYLQLHPDEFGKLFDHILVNATAFFRDPSTWEYLRQQVIPKLLEDKDADTPLRIWCAGCATGQEAYTIALLFADALGADAFSRRLKIYATDIDDDALNYARQGAYTAKELAGVSAQQLEQYFDDDGSRHTFSKELRRALIFGRQNLLYDAPISRVDLLVCRNALMYFNAEAQARILSSLHFALNDSGVLCLGKAEMLLTHGTLFTPLDLKRRVFKKVTLSYPRGRVLPRLAPRPENTVRSANEQVLLRDAAFEFGPVAQLVLDPREMLSAANEQARNLLSITPYDLGRPFAGLLVQLRLPGLQSSVDRAKREARAVHVAGAEYTRPGEEPPLYFDIIARQVRSREGAALGTHVSLIDVSATRRVQDELQQTTEELEAAYQELQSTTEELETTNEELQSTVEALETTNEQLQSTNEELEATNEELQSTNEELQNMNEELRGRSDELSRVNLFFEALLASLGSALVVLDLELRVQVWSRRAHELWGLSPAEVRGKHFLNLEIGLPIERLTAPVRACLGEASAHSEVTLPATTGLGRHINCHVTLSPLTEQDSKRGVILLMDERAGEGCDVK